MLQAHFHDFQNFSISYILETKMSINLVCVDSDGDTQSACQTKVGKLDDSTTVYQQILWLQISVNDTTLMAEKNCLQNLVQIALYNTQVKSDKVSNLTDDLNVQFHFINTQCITS